MKTKKTKTKKNRIRVEYDTSLLKELNISEHELLEMIDDGDDSALHKKWIDKKKET